MLSLECLMDMSSSEYVYNKLIMVVALPAAIMLLSTLVTMIIIIFRAEKFGIACVMNRCFILIAFFLIHPLLVKTILSFLKCEKIEDTRWLSISMDEECWTGDHEFYTLAVAVPGLIVWGIFTPLIVMLIIRRRNRIGKLDSVYGKMVYGFFYLGYKPRHYYWEIVVLYRKMIILFNLLFLANYDVAI